MTARNVQPIPFQYKCAVQLCEAEGRHESLYYLYHCTLQISTQKEALWAFEHAVEHGVAPDADTYSAAIRVCRKAGLDERAETLIDDMKLQTMRKSFIRRSSDSPQRGNNRNSYSSNRNGYTDRGSGGSYSGSQGRSSDRS
eukprot:15453-Heterococcus_DN1.PRE.2